MHKKVVLRIGTWTLCWVKSVLTCIDISRDGLDCGYISEGRSKTVNINKYCSVTSDSLNILDRNTVSFTQGVHTV